MRPGADVIVVGGGIIGCATAAELARGGAEVLLLERAEIASAASGRNHGLLFYPLDEITAPLYRASHEIYRELAAEGPIDFALDELPRGFVIAVASEEQWPAAKREATACAAGNVRVERLDADSLREAEPALAEGHLGAYWIDDGYRLDPAALTLAFALEASRAGAEVVTHCDVKQVLVEAGRVTGVASDRGIVSARVVVDAAGPWAPRLARSFGADLPLTGARGWLLLTRALPPLTNHLIESSGWHLTAGEAGPPPVTVGRYARGELPPAPDIGLLVQQNRSGHVLLGGSRLTSLREDPEGHEVTIEIARRAVATVPALAGAPIEGVWSGVRPMSSDGRPLVGWLAGTEGFFVAGGHGGQGVMLGGGSGRLATQMILGHHPFTDPAPFRPDR
ncbi:MAG: NAD(P)/FAD-dependent oxidoreductase [Actinomycetota bacterium]